MFGRGGSSAGREGLSLKMPKRACLSTVCLAAIGEGAPGGEPGYNSRPSGFNLLGIGIGRGQEPWNRSCALGSEN